MRKRAKLFADHMRSPVTIRSVFLFIAIVTVLYLVWRDIVDHQNQTDRYKRVDEQIARWQAVQNNTDRYTAVATQSDVATKEALQEMNRNFSEMTKALQQAELDRQTEHKEIARQLAASARIIDNANRAARTATTSRSRIKRTGSTCWATITTTEKFGAADIIKRELRRVPCPK